MAMQEVEYEFPEPDASNAEVEVSLEEKDNDSIEVEGAVGREDMKTPPKEVEDDSFEIEIEDDTPVADRGRKRSKPPEEVTDDELENYSEKVKGRIKHFSKGYHDERRAKETALREREELENYAKTLMAENSKLKGSADHSHNALITSARKQVQSELVLAQRGYKEAYEAGNSDAIVEAQQALNTAQIRQARVDGLKPREIQALQAQASTVQPQVNAPEPKPQPARDEKAESWRGENSWFGDDDEMTAFALGLHNKLTKGGEDPRSDTYYEKINTRMRQVFPEHFDEDIEDAPETKKKANNVVAPATRSTSPRKVTLKQSQVAIARRLGISLEDYAKQAAELMRNK